MPVGTAQEIMVFCTRDNGFLLKEGKFLLLTRKNFFAMKVEQERVAPSLETFKARLYRALSNPDHGRGVGLDELERFLPTQNIQHFSLFLFTRHQVDPLSCTISPTGKAD